MYIDSKGGDRDLAAREQILQQRYRITIGGQAVTWQGESVPVMVLRPLLLANSRRQREQVWRLITQRQAADAAAIDQLWQHLVVIRSEHARSPGSPLCPSSQPPGPASSPEDIGRFHYAIEEWVTPVVLRIHEERRQSLGVKRLRPWDLDVAPSGEPAAQAAMSLAGLRRAITTRLPEIDPARPGELTAPDDDSATATVPTVDCAAFPFADQPATMMPAGITQFFHQWGHELMAAHGPERSTLLSELGELAGIVAELLAIDQLTAIDAYSTPDTVRLQRRHLEDVLLRWPVAAMLDAFERWSYANPDQAADADSRAAQWRGLWLRFLPGVDWTDLEETLRHEWQRYLPLMLSPLTALVPAVAQIGAIQLWTRHRDDPSTAVACLRAAAGLSEGAPLIDHYAAAGLSFGLDEHALREAVDQIEVTLERLAAQ